MVNDIKQYKFASKSSIRKDITQHLMEVHEIGFKKPIKFTFAKQQYVCSKVSESGLVFNPTNLTPVRKQYYPESVNVALSALTRPQLLKVVKAINEEYNH